MLQKCKKKYTKIFLEIHFKLLSLVISSKNIFLEIFSNMKLSKPNLTNIRPTPSSTPHYLQPTLSRNHIRIQKMRLGGAKRLWRGPNLKKVPQFLKSHRISLPCCLPSNINQTFKIKVPSFSCYVQKHVNFVQFSGALGSRAPWPPSWIRLCQKCPYYRDILRIKERKIVSITNFWAKIGTTMKDNDLKPFW